MALRNPPPAVCSLFILFPAGTSTSIHRDARRKVPRGVPQDCIVCSRSSLASFQMAPAIPSAFRSLGASARERGKSESGPSDSFYYFACGGLLCVHQPREWTACVPYFFFRVGTDRRRVLIGVVRPLVPRIVPVEVLIPIYYGAAREKGEEYR